MLSSYSYSSGAEDAAIRIIDYFASEFYFETKAEPLGGIAQALERHGYSDLASRVTP